MKKQGGRINYYQILCVPMETHPDRIKSLYRELAKQHHPDVRGSSVDNLEWFQQLTAAYYTLGDARRKAAYDAQLKARVRDECVSVSARHPRRGRRPPVLIVKTVRRRRALGRMTRYTRWLTRW